MLRLPGSAGQAEAVVSIVEVAEESSGKEGKDNAKANWSDLWSDLFIIRNR